LVNSLVLISTPSQAFFLSHTPEVAKNAVLVITVKHKIESKKILGFLEKFNWLEIQIWKIPQADNNFVYLKLIEIRLRLRMLKSKYHFFLNVYLGSYANLVHLSVLSAYENSTKVYLLYDGLQLVSVNHFRNKSSNENKKNFPRAYRMLGFKEPKISKLTYYSPLEMEAKGEDEIEVIQRKERFHPNHLDEDIIYFIGQPLPDLGMVSSTFYIQTIKKLEKLLLKRIIYFPHPRENSRLINELSNDFEIRKPETIFEEYYLQLESVPGTIISFYSSVLVNLIYLKAPSKIIAIEIPSAEINGSRFKKLVAPVYDYFHKNSNPNFQVLDASNLKI
jgi:hypothetical protein